MCCPRKRNGSAPVAHEARQRFASAMILRCVVSTLGSAVMVRTSDLRTQLVAKKRIRGDYSTYTAISLNGRSNPRDCESNASETQCGYLRGSKLCAEDVGTYPPNSVHH